MMSSITYTTSAEGDTKVYTIDWIIRDYKGFIKNNKSENTGVNLFPKQIKKTLDFNSKFSFQDATMTSWKFIIYHRILCF